MIAYANTLFEQGRHWGAIADLRAALRQAKTKDHDSIRSGIAGLQVRLAQTFLERPDGMAKAKAKAITYVNDCLARPEETNVGLLRDALKGFENEKALLSRDSHGVGRSGHPAGFPGPFSGGMVEQQLLEDI